MPGMTRDDWGLLRVIIYNHQTRLVLTRCLVNIIYISKRQKGAMIRLLRTVNLRTT